MCITNTQWICLLKYWNYDRLLRRAVYARVWLRVAAHTLYDRRLTAGDAQLDTRGTFDFISLEKITEISDPLVTPNLGWVDHNALKVELTMHLWILIWLPLFWHEAQFFWSYILLIFSLLGQRVNFWELLKRTFTNWMPLISCNQWKQWKWSDHCLWSAVRPSIFTAFIYSVIMCGSLSSSGRCARQLRPEWQLCRQRISQGTSHIWNDPGIFRLWNHHWTH